MFLNKFLLNIKGKTSIRCNAFFLVFSFILFFGLNTYSQCANGDGSFVGTFSLDWTAAQIDASPMSFSTTLNGKKINVINEVTSNAGGGSVTFKGLTANYSKSICRCRSAFRWACSVAIKVWRSYYRW